ncbi:MAG: hypothetical protein O3B68_10320 [Planctomycetota bacterium]|nr:hypothetical protein [Planctomycetota bacterium]
MKSLVTLACGLLIMTGEAIAQGQPLLPGPSSPAAANLPEPIFTSRQAFRIPYQYDPQEIARLGASEVRLYVSQNRGQNWQAVQKVAPQAGKFDFQAASDGEYWFAVQTVDRNNQLHPGGAVFQPGLIVIVDTTKPSLKIDLKQSEPGRIAMNWSIDDASVDASSIVLEFTQTGMSDWQQIPVKPSASGQTSWAIPQGGLVAVRGRVKDSAGNEAQSQYQVDISPVGSLTPAANTPSPVGVPDFSAPIASGQNPLLSGLPTPGTNPMLGALPPRPTNSYSDNNYPDNGYASNSALPFPGNPGHSATQPLATPSPFGPAVTGSAPGAGIGGVPGPSGSTPQWQQQNVSSIPGTGNPSQIPAYELPTPVGHRIVKSRQFSIDYRIDDIGPSGVAEIGLFVSQNNGDKWYRYGIDEDNRSPFEVDVPSDGVYGFSIRATSGAGLTEPPPQPGERPDFSIVVDSSPPVVNLFPLQQGTGADANRILITWKAADQKLADRPIALSYAANPNGPWQQISDWLPNTGQYIWNVGQGIPPRLYVRVVARDAAGNLARVDTPQPVLVDLAKPTARIVDVESSISNGSGSF